MSQPNILSLVPWQTLEQFAVRMTPNDSKTWTVRRGHEIEVIGEILDDFDFESYLFASGEKKYFDDVFGTGITKT